MKPGLSQEPMFFRFAAILGGIFLGGKDTNAEWLQGQFSDYLVHQTTSGLLTSYPAAAEAMKSGKMVENGIVYDAIDNFLFNLGKPKGLLGNGWIRKPKQAPEVYARLIRSGYKNPRFIEFQVNDDDVLEERRLRRWNQYHRPDDEHEKAWGRIREYRDLAVEIAESCRLVGFDIFPIDASQSLSEVKRQFAQAIIIQA